MQIIEIPESIRETKIRLGLFGGTFDPVHTAHIKIIRAIKQKENLDFVIFIPAKKPPHKNEPGTLFIHRYEMLRLALSSEAGFLLSDIENKFSGPSYSFDTVAFYKKNISPASELFFIMGADNVFEIKTWHKWKDFLSICTVLAVKRPGVSGKIPDETEKSPVLEKIKWVEAPFIDMDSTDIRKKISAGQSLEGLLAPEVCDYIRENQLYGYNEKA